jgi:hypothetical protein
MGRVYSVVGFVVAIGLIVLLGWAVVRGVIDEPGVVGSFATAAAAIAALVYGRAREQRLALQASHREKMAPIYREVIERFVKYEESGEGDLTEFFQSFMFDLSVYSPTPVVEAWIRWMRLVEGIDAAVVPMGERARGDPQGPRPRRGRPASRRPAPHLRQRCRPAPARREGGPAQAQLVL